MPLRLASPDGQDRDAQSSLLSPGWGQNRRSISSGRARSLSQGGTLTLRDNLINTAEKIYEKVMATVQKMSLLQKILAGAVLTAAGVLGILFLIFNEKIFHALEPFALRWKRTTGGWTILWAMTFMTAFPPLIGYSMCGTLAGFVYGIWEGWFILMTASVAGSFCSFIVSRTILRGYVERMVANDKRFAALTLVLKHDGLKLLCMIRLCPLPYSISNGAMSTFPTVDPFMYAAATALVSPKLFIHAFIGSRLAAIARTGEQMTTKDRAVNWASILIGVTVGAFTGWFIYRKTMARAHELEAEEAQNVKDTVRRTGGLTRQFSDDPEAQVAADTLAADDDDVAYFDDAPSPKPPYSDHHNQDDDAFASGDDSGEVIGLRGQRK